MYVHVCIFWGGEGWLKACMYHSVDVPILGLQNIEEKDCFHRA